MIRIPVEGPIVTSRRNGPIGLAELRAEFRRSNDITGRDFRIEGRGMFNNIDHQNVEHYILVAAGSHTERQNMVASARFGRVLFGLVVLVEIGKELA